MRQNSCLTTLSLLVIIFTLVACQKDQAAEDEAWDFDWESFKTFDPELMDGRQLIGAYDLEDVNSEERYEVFLLYDNGGRRGTWLSIMPYTLTAFYSSDGKIWKTHQVAEGTRCSGFSKHGQSQHYVLLQAHPYYIGYSEIDDPMRKKVHQPMPVTLSIRDGVPSLKWQGPAPWDDRTRHAAYNEHNTAFTGTIRSATAWGFASYTQASPMTYYYLELDRLTTFNENLSEGDNVAYEQSEIHLSPATEKLHDKVADLLNKRVTIVGECFHEHTAHHRRPVVISAEIVAEIQVNSWP